MGRSQVVGGRWYICVAACNPITGMGRGRTGRHGMTWDEMGWNDEPRCLQQTHRTKSITIKTTTALITGPMMSRRGFPVFTTSDVGVPGVGGVSVGGGGLPFPSVQVAMIVDPSRVYVCVLMLAS